MGYTLPCPTPYFPKYTLEFINKSESFNVRNNLESDFGPAQFITQLTHVLSVMEAVDASAILDFITHWPKGSTPPRTTLLIPYIYHIYDIRTHILLLLKHLVTHWPTVNTNTGKSNQMGGQCLLVKFSYHIGTYNSYLTYNCIPLISKLITHPLYRGQHHSTNQGEARDGQFLPLISHWRAPQLTRIYTIPKELTALCSST